jgi:4-amino-4-deoxy-L-arabinose transferase-like glycosyltransferase
MRAAKRDPFWICLGLLLLGALALRLWGSRNGLPYVYNADENAHFVPRAIGMFDHSYNPGYFINPPAFTYLLHALFWLRWGGDGVQSAFAADPGDVFALGRAAAAVLGTVAVGLLVWAGSIFFERRTGIVAGVLMAVAFLPVHYAHLALNDVPTLAPLALALVGVAGVLRSGRALDYAIAGAGLGLACATKYTAGIVLLCLAAATVLGPGRPGVRAQRVAIAGGVALVAFTVANPYALFDFSAFRDGLHEQASASSDGGGKLGLTETNGIAYYLRTTLWGLGAIPALAVVGGGVWLARRHHRTAAVLVPAPVLFLLFMGTQDRFFARWLLPVYPILCLLAAYGAVRALDRLPRVSPRWAAAGAAVLLGAQGFVLSVHNDRVLARADTRQVARDWLVANVPEGGRLVVEPIAPDQWATDAGKPSLVTGNGNRWIKFKTSRSRVNNDGTLRRGIGRRVKLEDYERTTRPQLIDSYEHGGFCHVVTGSTQYGRAFAEPGQVPNAIRYYDELKRRGKVVFRVSPYDEGAGRVAFSFDDSFNYRPLAYARPGPEIVIYRLSGGRCGTS